MEKDLEFLGEMFPMEKERIYEVYIESDCKIDETISALIAQCEKGPRHPPSYEEAISNGGAACSSGSLETSLSKKRRDSRRNLGKKEWKLPIIGKLSDDFLQVPSEILHNSAPTGYNCKGCAKLKQKDNSEESYASFASSIPSSIAGSNVGEIDSIIRKRMEENVCQTRYATMGMNGSDDNIQYLDDERLALMLQNQEFRSIVKADPEFQQALEEDVKDQDFEFTSDIWQERDESVIFRPQDFGLDYGYERSDIVDPDEVWPDRPTVSSSNDVSAMMKAMGKASKKRLSSIAKRFASMRRNSRTSRHYADIEQFPDFNVPSRSNRWGDTESTHSLVLTDGDSASFIHRPDRSSRNPMSVISERSSSSTLI